MREIKFRGKCVDNGVWVEGYYGKKGIEEYTQHCIMQSVLSNQPFTYFYFSDCEVLPETIGQFTGLHDKNGKEIYEGNICKFRYFKNDYVGKVVFNQKTCSFEMQNYITVGTYGNRAVNTRLLCHIEQIKIIGNIFDNPELLESEE